MKLMKLFFSATAICLLLATSGAATADRFTGCLKDNGKLKRVSPGELPTKACKKKEIDIQFPSQEQIDVLEAAAQEAVADAQQAFRNLINSVQPEPPGADLEVGDVIPGPPPPDPDCTAAVGDTGPGGGWIFLVYAEEGECKGLEASKEELTAGARTQFGCDGTFVGAIGSGYGDGRDNTGYIINEGCTSGTDAADLANDYVWPNDQTDGYLPSIDELMEMWAAIGPGADNVGGFDPDQFYWTSTESAAQDGAANASSVNFASTSGQPQLTPKDFLRLVHAVRVFEITPTPTP